MFGECFLLLLLSTGFSSEIGTKLRDWAVGQAGGSCYSQAAFSSNDSKTRYFDYTLLFLVSLQIRVVCLSDTHSLTSHMKRPIPNGDILIHAGDFTRCGNMKEVRVQERVVVRGDTYMTSALSGGGGYPIRDKHY